MPPEDKRLRVVVDTNVLFSALAFPAESPPARVFKLIVDGKILALSSPFIADELENNLRHKAGWDEAQLRALRRRLKLMIRLVVPTSRLSVIKRIEADNRVLECAVDAHADVLITGNLKDLRPIGAFQGMAILTPREFLTRYFPK
ncbi:MAG: putative toxin-antitoxin system toxin component, PIN family [Candidatus Omnitrophica bacterium]|nr:putative toxin-antitoxin system toxin component, PIN family [Candidatus Omnitrophota bacterium]